VFCFVYGILSFRGEDT
jgi:hypothetical protein